MPSITRDDGSSRRRAVTCTVVADLIIRANENVHNAEENRKLQYMTEFRALRERLVFRSTFFMAELPRKHLKQTPRTFTLEGDNSSIAIELWFVILQIARATSSRKNPTEHRGLHLEPRAFVGPANAACGHLKTVLHRELWDVCLRLHYQQCACRKETYFDYQDKLMKVRAWPLDHVFQHSSMNDIISRLSKLSYTPTTTTCTAPFLGCRRGLDDIVEEACRRTARDFDGLCLDCMDRSKPKREDDDEDYWRHNYPANGCWDMGCRFRHSRSTWYHSWMGRPDKRR